MNIETSILVIDDEPQNFEVMEILLFKEGYSLHFALNATEALNFLEEIQPDTILLDVMMPDFDGVELCRRIRANYQWRYIPILMVTALNAKEDLADCLDAGADDFISKPVSGIELRARVRSMLRIKHQYDLLQAALRLREDMANMIVHDFSNHLVPIVLGCDIIAAYAENIPQLQKQINRMEHSAKQLQSLADSLLMLAKIESGKMSLQRTKVSIIEILESVTATFQTIADHRNIQLISDISDINKFVYVDRQILRRVLDNLVSNALKFSPQNSQIMLRVEYPENAEVRIKVIDEGNGVNDSLKPILFDKYEIGNVLESVSQTGLGLAFCRMAIEAHNGKIYIEDNQPQGAIFTVEI